MRILVLLVAVVLCAASAQPMEMGERGDGICPEAECSPDTPDGLLFVGQRVAADESAQLHPTAVGGVQTFRIDGLEGASAWAVEGTDDLTAELDGLNERLVHVRAVGPNGGYLRVYDPDTGELHDRIFLDTAEITSARLDGFRLGSTLVGEAPTVFFADSLSGARLTLRSGEAIVIDGDMSLTSGPAAEVVPLLDDVGEPVSYDSFELAVAGPGDGALVVAAGGAAFDVPVVIVDETDLILGTLFDPAEDDRFPISTMYCFEAHDAFRLVAGAPWSYAVSEGLAIDTESELPPSCVGLDAVAPGPAELTVTAGPTTRTYALTVAAGSTKPAPRNAASLAAPSARGERAGR